MNLINIDLTALNSENLKKLAKEAKVSGWWTMKKAELLEILTTMQEEQKEEEHLTEADIEEAVKKAAEELGIENPEIAPQKKTPKKTKANKVEKNEENLVTLKELAAEFHMKGTKARRLLRNETAARPFGGNRWEWDKDLHKEALEAARAVLKAHTK